MGRDGKKPGVQMSSPLGAAAEPPCARLSADAVGGARGPGVTQAGWALRSPVRQQDVCQEVGGQSHRLPQQRLRGLGALWPGGLAGTWRVS